jgi:hypothetical protein
MGGWSRSKRSAPQREPRSGRRFTVVASRWDRGWEVYVLGGSDVIGSSRCAARDEVAAAAEKVLREAGLAGEPFGLELICEGRDLSS